MTTQDPAARPIFVVGSPRSGTSILTWCLGQHPNILPLEEGNWLDKFAFELGSTFERGSRNGDRSQLSSLGVGVDQFYQWFGLAANELVLKSRGRYFERARSVAVRDPAQVHPSFQLRREDEEPKQRWVDGTPEYSYCIFGLAKLFPEGRFIHIVRDVASVVRSLMRFSPGGQKMVSCERAAYDYWLRTTRACMRAEKAFGSARIRRVRYIDLAEDPARTFEGILDFLGEDHCPRCLEPLQQRINSSRVPVSYDSRDGTTPADLAAEAEALSIQLQTEQRSQGPDPQEMASVEQDFWDRVKYIGSLDEELERSNSNYRSLEAKLISRTEWAQRLDKEIAQRDETIREYQRELGRRTIAHGLWRLGAHISRILRPTGGA